MDREKINRDVVVRVQKSLFNKFNKKCKNNYKTMSEVIRDFMVKFIKDENKID